MTAPQSDAYLTPEEDAALSRCVGLRDETEREEFLADAATRLRHEVADLRRRVERTVEYVGDLLALDNLSVTERLICQAVHDSLTTPVVPSAKDDSAASGGAA